jgi:hypothetical protein
MWEFLGNVLTTSLSIAGSLFIAFRIYDRSSKDEASRLEEVLRSDRQLRDEQALRESRIRRTEGLMVTLSETSHALQMLTAAIHSSDWTAAGRLGSELREVSWPLGRHVGLNIFDEQFGKADPVKKFKGVRSDSFRSTLGFAVSYGRRHLQVAGAVGQLLAADEGRDQELVDDAASFTTVLLFSLFTMAREVEHWQDTGDFRSTSIWPDEDYAERVFDRVGMAMPTE